MTVQRVRVGDFGTIIRLRVINETGAVEDISGTSLRQIVLTAPDHTARVVSANFVNTGSDGLMQYVTVSNDINQIGRWEARARVEFSSGTQHFTSEPLRFDAGPAQ